MKLAIGHATDKGQLRANNEDAFLVDDAHGVFAVADGMGGHQGGEIASRTAIEALRAEHARGTGIDAAIVSANRAVIARAAGHADLEGMGTTMTAAAAAEGRRFVIGHVGDSRAYLLHEGSLRRITEDHSLVEEMVRDGRLTPEQAEAHPQRAIVTRALGLDEDVDVDVYRVDVEPGDRMVLCSDGLTVMVRERDVERIGRTEPDPQRAAELLVAAANEAGGEDNITVVVVDVLEVDAAGTADAGGPAGTESAAAAEPTRAEPLAPVPAAQPRRRRRPRLRTVRAAVVVVLPLVLIVGVATAALGVYARRSYFVGASREEVVIFKGVPGGVLGWDPTVERRTGIRLDDLAPLERGRVENKTSRGSLDTAEEFVANLKQMVDATSTTTTTRPPRTTTSRPRRTTTTTRRP
jgi:protein phosphatase